MSATTETAVLVDLANGQEAAALDHIERALNVLDEAEDYLIEDSGGMLSSPRQISTPWFATPKHGRCWRPHSRS